MTSTLNGGNINNFPRAVGNHALLSNVLRQEEVAPDIQIHNLNRMEGGIREIGDMSM